MKVLHIPAKSRIKVELDSSQIKLLPKKIGVVTTVQYIDQLDNVVKQVKGVRGGQILGCDSKVAEKIKAKVSAFLYVGSGMFHPIRVYLRTKKPVYCFNPKTKQLSKLKKEVVERFEKKKKTSLIKFHSARKIGILVSVKPGQKDLDNALKLKKKLEMKDKECFIFVFDTLNINELENFPFIECWINTACPRIADEKSEIISIEDVEKTY